MLYSYTCKRVGTHSVIGPMGESFKLSKSDDDMKIVVWGMLGPSHVLNWNLRDLGREGKHILNGSSKIRRVFVEVTFRDLQPSLCLCQAWSVGIWGSFPWIPMFCCFCFRVASLRCETSGRLPPDLPDGTTVIPRCLWKTGKPGEPYWTLVGCGVRLMAETLQRGLWAIHWPAGVLFDESMCFWVDMLWPYFLERETAWCDLGLIHFGFIICLSVCAV